MRLSDTSQKDASSVLVIGNFNIVHPGHLRLLRFAKECGDKLIVAVNSDQKAATAAHVGELDRLEGIKSNQWVDEAFIVDDSDAEVVRFLKPDVVVKGKEHELGFNPEGDVLEQYGGRLLFSSGETTFSTIELLRKEFNEFDPKTIHMPRNFVSRHKIQVEKVVDLIQKFDHLNICVVGDLIVDEYITCEPLGMSQEEPTIVVTPLDSIRFIGGAGIVAAHAAGLGASVSLLSITGDDDSRRFAVDQLQEFKVDASLFIDKTRPTPLKQRFRSKGKSLLKVSHLHQDSISTKLQMQIKEKLEGVLCDVDLLVFSDFNYGCLPQSLVNEIINLAKKNHVLLAADSQSSSQVGDIARFRGMDLITPTEHECRVSTKNYEDGLVVLAGQLRKISDAKNIFLKMGEEGLLIDADRKNDSNIFTDQVRALNSSSKDVAGAGDSMLISSTMAMALGANIWEMAFIGSVAAAIQVGRVGNIPLKQRELISELLL